MRFRAALWRGGVILAWLGALVLLARAGSGTDDQPYLLGGIPLTIATGALINRFWAVFVPSTLEILALVVALISSGFSDCADCSDGEGWGYLILVVATIFTIPATVALLVGVGGRRLTGFFRGLPTGDEGGSENA